MTKYNGGGGGGGGVRQIWRKYHEIAENIPKTKVKEVARYAHTHKKRAKNTRVHIPRMLGNPNRKGILDILQFRKYDVSWRGGGGQPNTMNYDEGRRGGVKILDFSMT